MIYFAAISRAAFHQYKAIIKSNFSSLQHLDLLLRFCVVWAPADILCIRFSADFRVGGKEKCSSPLPSGSEVRHRHGADGPAIGGTHTSLIHAHRRTQVCTEVRNKDSVNLAHTYLLESRCSVCQVFPAHICVLSVFFPGWLYLSCLITDLHADESLEEFPPSKDTEWHPVRLWWMWFTHAGWTKKVRLTGTLTFLPDSCVKLIWPNSWNYRQWDALPKWSQHLMVPDGTNLLPVEHKRCLSKNAICLYVLPDSQALNQN